MVKFYHIDSFTDRGFGGAAAPVILVVDPLETDQALAIAGEFNQPVMTFLRPTSKGCEARFFETKGHVGHVGHAALAAGYIALDRLYPERPEIALENSIDGMLNVQRDGDLTVIEFATMPASVVPKVENLDDALGGVPIVETLFCDFGALAVLGDEDAVRALRLDINKAMTVPGSTLIVTARGRAADFVSRVFAPKFDLPEDPVCGAAHRILVPYWVEKLRRTKLTAHQGSPRGGRFQCELRGDRVRLGGRIAMLFEADFSLPAKFPAATTRRN